MTIKDKFAQVLADPIYQESISRYEQIIKEAKEAERERRHEWYKHFRNRSPWQQNEAILAETMLAVTMLQNMGALSHLITAEEHDDLARLTSHILRRHMQGRGAHDVFNT